MGVVAALSYNGVYALISSNAIATLSSIVLAIIVFAICVFVFKIFTKEEIESLPMGKKISSALVKMHIY